MIAPAISSCVFPVALILGLGPLAPAQEAGSWSWSFAEAELVGGGAAGEGSPEAQRASDQVFGPADRGGGVVLNGAADVFALGSPGEAGIGMPEEAFSVAAWVAIERPHRWGGIVGCVQDNGEAERGFVLGYGEETFSFGLATEGADDGDGRLTYLSGKTAFVPGRWHHVAATYDGQRMRLYVDGKLDAESAEQSGAVLYDLAAPFVIGCYRDDNEEHVLDGRLLAVSMGAGAWGEGDVRAAYRERAALTELEPWTDTEFGFLVEPYLTWPTQTAMSVMFEATFPCAGLVRVRGESDKDGQWMEFSMGDAASLHECRVTGLEPDRKYFYSVLATGPGGEQVESPLLSFRTAACPGKAFTFVVVGDTQTHGDVAKRVSDVAWMHRPNLVVHAGDLVDTGTNKRDWTDVFFPSMQPLIGRVPLMPVLGNHEQDAPHYYRYMSLPEPERWYSFRFGDAEFFMIDGNRSLAEQSAQLNWLKGALSKSKAKWRFAVLHQPPYTSDADDYGDTTKTTSTRGDPNVRNIIGLLERFGVDMCFSGHVHDYERTFPIRGEQVEAYEDGGVIYVTAAGGGGSLEDFDPANTWFGHKKARYHHLVYVAIHGDHLEFQAIDEHGNLFDSLALKKRGSR